MKSVCLDARMIHHSGIGTYIKNLIPFLEKGPFRLRLILPSSSLQEYAKFDLIACDAPLYSLREQWELFCKIPACDLFWSPSYNIPLLPIRAKRRLVTIHDVFHLVNLHRLTFLQRIYAKIVFSAAVRLAKRVITVSHFSADEICKTTSIQKEKLKVIYHGVDHYYFKEVPSNGVLNEPFVLYVGNVKPHKNLKNLIQAFEMLKGHPEYAAYRLVIVGQKSGFIHGEEIESASFLTFTGKLSDAELISYYRRAKALAFPSLYEGFGLPPLEAMAFGCPVIVSQVGAMPEIYGDSALYVKPESVSDIYQALLRLLKEPALREELIQKGKARSAQFLWETSATEHLALLEEVMNERLCSMRFV